MSNPHCKTPSGQSPQNDLVNTPEHFHPGYCGQPRKYDPREFGLTGNEEWRNPRMFRNMTYQTDAEAMNAMRMAQPRRPMYRPTETSIVNNLTDECLADVSAPQFEMSMPSPMSGSCGEYLDNVTPPQLCTTADSSVSEKDSNNCSGSIQQRVVHDFSQLSACDYDLLPAGNCRDPDQNSMPDQKFDKCSTEKNNNILTTTVRTITTQRDQSGKVTSRVEETSTVSNDQGANLDNTPVCCPGQGPAAGRHLQFCNMPDQSENLADISMPPFYDNSHPAMSTRIAQRSMDQSACLENISAPSFADSNLADVSMPSGICGANGDSIRQPTQYTNECLNNVSMPSCMGSSGASRRQVTQMSHDRLEDISMPSFGNVSRVPNRQAGYMTSECLNDVSAPSFGSSPARSRVYRSQPRSMLAQSNLNSTVLDDISMPSFEGTSCATARSMQQRSMKSQNICDTSAPSYVSYGQGPGSGECLENISMPMYGYSGRAQMTNECLEEVTMPSFECSTNNQFIEDISMPTFGGVSYASQGRTPTRQQYSMPAKSMCCSMEPCFQNDQQEYLDQVTMPSFGNSTRGPMPSECLTDISMPSFGGVSGASRGRTPSCQQRSMAAQNMCNISGPIYESSRVGQMTNECLDDVTQPSYGNSGREVSYSQFIEEMSMPSFGGVSGASRPRTPTRQQQQSMASQNICDISAPSFAGSGRGTISNEYSGKEVCYSPCLEEESMPSFGGVSGVSRPRTPTRQQQQSMASQNICDVSAPSFASSGRQLQTTPSQNICDVSAPSFASSGRRQQQQSMPSQNICDVSAPSFASSGRQQQSMATQNICDISAPSFNSSGRCASKSECLENVTMPSGVAVSTSSRRQRTSIAECLDNVSAPSFAHSTLRSRSPQRRQRSRQNDSGEKCQTTTTTSEIIDEISMPTCGDVSGSSKAKTPIRQKRSITTKTVCKSSTPASRSRGPMNSTAECIAARGQTPKRRQQTMTSQNICDISAPSLESCGTGGLTNECLNDISMPSYGASLECSRPNTCASECLNDVSAPSFAQSISRGSSHRQQMALSNACKSGTGDMSNGYIMDISMPSFGGISGASRQRTLNQQQQQCSMPSQNICDISPVSYASSGRGNTMTNECLYDVSMPSFAEVSGSSQRQQTMPSECLNDVSAPSFTRTMPSQVAQRSIQNRSDQCRLQDMSMPSFADVSGVSRARTLSRQQRSMRGSPGTRECLEDVSMPSFGVSGVSCARCPTMQSQQICDISAPSYNSSGFATMTSKSMGRSQSQGPNSRVQQSPIMNNSCRVQSECLQNVTMPSFGNISTVSTSSRRDLPMTSECLSNVTPPSFGRSGNTQELWNISAPVFESSANLRKPRSEPSYECDALEDESAPSFGFNSQAMKSIYQIPTANSSNSVYSGTAARQVRSFPCISQQNIGDISAPSMVSSRVDCQLDSRGQPYPTEYPFSKSRSQSKQSSRYTNCNLDCEAVENITEPSMLANSTMYGQMATEQSQCLADVSAPSGMESQFSTLCSKLTNEESYPSEMLQDVSAPSYANSINRSQSKQTTRVTTCTLNCENIENVTEPSILTNSARFGKIVSERLREASQHLADVSAPSGMDSHYSNVESNIMDVSEPCEMFCSDVCAEEGNASERGQLDKSDPRATNSSPSMKRGEGSALTGQRNNQDEQSPTDCPCPSTVDVEAKKSSTSGQGVAGAQDSKKRDSNAGKKSIQSINDISMPEFESTPISQSPRESNRKNSTAISDITEPSFGPSLQSTNKTQDTTGSYHGFDSMDNYAPFDELINSRPENCEPPTPQPVRSKPNDCPATPKPRPKTPQKGHCTCGVNGNTRSSAKQRSRNTNR
ncbi:PREDICTED: uncharacterized protein LOC108620163 [Drosophila arizonae]|uniref:Uncharacterized protein LOC108620163 n=1 Tax=Drosophila arizonae TaxID=7263 RepID=A0ABM1PZB0_DROAR|nr:PREDICTED: uncharacterized protein LOC108620163 [Drosophila arizonae]